MRSLIYTVLLCFAVTACALEPSKAPPATGASGDDPAAASTEAPAPSEDTATQDELGEAITPHTTGCAHVVFCKAPGSGTLCKQDSCSLAAAEKECLADLKAISCTFVCPGRIEIIGGGTRPMCCPGVCSVGCPC